MMMGVQALCITTNNNTFTVKVNLFAGELGYFMFEECGHEVNPTIGMKVGETYHFVQADRSNYYHAMGFAYYPDGAHADDPELEPSLLGDATDAECMINATCPAPMYFRGTDYLGTYSNIAELAPLTFNEDDFGLDVYEPEFFYPLDQWASTTSAAGPYQVYLNFNNFNYTRDIFYFCHIHQFMSGRIKLLDEDSNPINTEGDTPALGYKYDKIQGLDAGCGTYGLNPFMLPNKYCPGTFVCGRETSRVSLNAQCIEAMNCHMFQGMTTSFTTKNPVALFLHQMIPHHENAVNMAKALLNVPDKLNCTDLANEDDPNYETDCQLELILRSIVNDQNFQIQSMKNLLRVYNFPETDNCNVEISESRIRTSDDTNNNTASNNGTATNGGGNTTTGTTNNGGNTTTGTTNNGGNTSTLEGSDNPSGATRRGVTALASLWTTTAVMMSILASLLVTW
ncbi:hypothetical protein ACA910_005146 [Epithemia clementina (nom. ined.)]